MTGAPALPRLLAIMGSGETSPTMVKTHRGLLERLGPPPIPAVLLDTPFGFQENAGELTEKAVQYFSESVGTKMEVASFRSAADQADAVSYERMLARLRHARYVFAGPGSPSYALSQWEASAVPSVMRDKLEQGGCITFASAAALTLGIVTVPVYEIYKVGTRPHWMEGLDLLSVSGLSAAVIPHYNNAEGGNHDTRFCYLGERRLSGLEAELPEGAFVLGVDEHTGCVIDLDAATAAVVGLGVMTIRVQGRSVEVPNGATLAVPELRAMAADLARGGTERPAGGAGGAGGSGGAGGAGGSASGDAAVGHDARGGRLARSPLLETIRSRQAGFDAAVAAGDADGAVREALGLDGDLAAWAADTLQSDERDRGRAALRSMITTLGELAGTGLRDPKQLVGPFIELVLGRRRAARKERRFAEADSLRDDLVALGVEIRDSAGGTGWDLRAEAGPEGG